MLYIAKSVISFWRKNEALMGSKNTNMDKQPSKTVTYNKVSDSFTVLKPCIKHETEMKLSMHKI